MHQHKTLGYTFVSLFVMMFLSVTSFAQQAPVLDTSSDREDSIEHATANALENKISHQVCVSFDVFQALLNYNSTYREGYELAVDYYYKKDLYLVAEGGWGHSHLNNSRLSYASNNSFYRVGFNKSLLNRSSPKDWDMAFIGLRLAAAPIQRGQVTYTIIDNYWGTTNGTINATNFVGVWAELTGGFRVELFKGLFLGYSIRGKFLLNQKPFLTLAPIYVAGYGKSEKNAVFDFNAYITYAIRWKKGRSMPATTKK